MLRITTISTLCFFIIAVSSFSIKTKQKDLSLSFNYTFVNYTGLCVSQNMVSLYLRTINDAFSFYAEDYNNNTKYIQSRLEGNYPSDNFQVIIVTQNSTAGGWVLFSDNGCSVVCWSGVNKARPQWIYIIVKFFPDEVYPNAYVDSLSRGPGIDDNMHSIISEAIINAEGAGPCTCRNLQKISENKAFQQGSWNVICKTSTTNNTMFSRIKASSLRYDYLSPKDINCQYLLWTM